jgi:REP element-mobilizing transposase RayT
MARQLRIHVPGGFYHTTLRGNHREAIFSVESDRLLLNTIVELALAKHGARIHAYCWMTNHLHLLVQVSDDPLAHLIRRIASGYARAYQANRDTTGHLFENRYHSVLVDTDVYLLELIRYIHLNPVRAGLAPAAPLYRWSSHHVYSGLNVDRWVTTDFGLGMFASDRSRAIACYCRFVNCDASEVPSPFDEVSPHRPHILGSEAFAERVLEQKPIKQTHRTLESLFDEGCQRHGLSREELASKQRNGRIMRARAWVARQAIALRVASVVEIARALNCDPKSIRNALRKFGDKSMPI